MAKRKDTAATAATNETTPAPDAPKIEITRIEPPNVDLSNYVPPKIELPNIESPAIDPLKAETNEAAAQETSHEIPDDVSTRPAFATLVAKPFNRSRVRTRRFALLAASVALAAAIGGIVGAATTSGFSRPAPVVDTAAATQTRALKENVVRLSTELATVRAGIESAHKTAAVQFGKLAERLDRSEKAQAEPTAKLAKIMDTLDRLERRPQMASAATSDVTGSITTVEKQQTKPPMIEGWRLRDFYAGRAVIENRSGALYEVAAGANLPGIGRVESVKREDGRVVITTAKGVIAANLEQQPRRQPYYQPPYRY